MKKDKIKAAIIGASGYSGEELVRLLLSHPHVELLAVTSRQNAGLTVGQVFPKFASHPLSRTLHFTEPDAEALARKADVVFLALPHGVAAEFAVTLLKGGCTVIDLSADFRLKSPEVYKEFYAHDHPAPELLHESVYGLPLPSPAHCLAGLLSHEHPVAADSPRARRPHQAGEHYRQFAERRQRSGPEGGDRLPVL